MGVGQVEVEGVLVHAVGVDRTGTGQQRGGQVQAHEAWFASGGVEGRTALQCGAFDRIAPIRRGGRFGIHHRDGGNGDDVDPSFQVADDVGDDVVFTSNRGRAVGDAIRLGVQNGRHVVCGGDADIGGVRTVDRRRCPPSSATTP